MQKRFVIQRSTNTNSQRRIKNTAFPLQKCCHRKQLRIYSFRCSNICIMLWDSHRSRSRSRRTDWRNGNIITFSQENRLIASFSVLIIKGRTFKTGKLPKNLCAKIVWKTYPLGKHELDWSTWELRLRNFLLLSVCAFLDKFAWRGSLFLLLIDYKLKKYSQTSA